ncbi:MAG: hypothetical protein ALECFALPRED_004207 [Alectoria fallacina]|uniref:FAD-binding domain-containing protein n=1 Tax=Alectoria fallacina TaxID=1903189 RepID=A0A8H3I9B3_9LECA|nr:MAG: hypothetical protein ALECFALPRED_004207 [Alectoria fallacina]
MENPRCHVAVVGGGLGGLAAAIAIRRQGGHDVTVLERTKELSEIGAGIELPPNSTRILKRWGILDAVRDYSTEPDRLLLRSYRDGSVLSDVGLVPFMEEAYGAPWLLIHRANFQKVLAKEAERLGATIELEFHVTEITCTSTSIVVSSAAGAELRPDVLLGADGLHSACRAEIQQGSSNSHVVTENMAYRITIKAEDMQSHPELVSLLESPDINGWMGPGAHVVSYTLKETDLYNFVFICGAHLGDVVEMRDFFRGWDPRLRLLLDIAQGVSKWPLCTSIGTGEWVHPEANFALLGDACHAMLPFLAQGAAQAVEDGAILGALFEHVQHKSEVRDSLIIYEQLRRSRSTKIVQGSIANGEILHMQDGEAQRDRDRQLRDDAPFEGYPNRWADPVFQKWLFGHDVFAEAYESRVSHQESLASKS